MLKSCSETGAQEGQFKKRSGVQAESKGWTSTYKLLSLHVHQDLYLLLGGKAPHDAGPTTLGWVCAFSINCASPKHGAQLHTQRIHAPFVRNRKQSQEPR
eukprot:1141689-Pelagomonas_calceolata.AAC.7